LSPLEGRLRYPRAVAFVEIGLDGINKVGESGCFSLLPDGRILPEVNRCCRELDFGAGWSAKRGRAGGEVVGVSLSWSSERGESTPACPHRLGFEYDPCSSTVIGGRSTMELMCNPLVSSVSEGPGPV
jgi:hypothetical protein